MISMNNQNTAWRLTAGCLLGFFLMSVCPGAEWIVSAQATPQQDLDRAQDLYDFAEFQQALELATGLIDGKQLTGNNLRDAYILRARCAVGLGLNTMAQEDFCSVLKLQKDWAPDPVVYPKDEVEVFNASKGQCDLMASQTKTQPKSDSGESKAWYKNPVVLGIGAAAVIGGVVAMSGGGDDDTPADPDLPGFPALPE